MRYKETLMLFSLFCIVAANIQIRITPGANVETTTILANGVERARATNNDLEAFDLSETKVRHNLERLGWYKVDDLMINNFKNKGYRGIHITIQPKLAKILRVKQRNIKLSGKTYRNEHKVTKKFYPEVKQYVADNIGTKWYNTKNISVGHNISHVVDGTEYKTSYGRDGDATKVLLLKAKSNGQIVLASDEYVKATLLAKETVIEALIDYEVSLDGEFYFGIYCTHIFQICPRHINLNVNEYFGLLYYPTTVKSYEITTITYYHEPQLKVGEVRRNLSS